MAFMILVGDSIFELVQFAAAGVTLTDAHRLIVRGGVFRVCVCRGGGADPIASDEAKRKKTRPVLTCHPPHHLLQVLTGTLWLAFPLCLAK